MNARIILLLTFVVSISSWPVAAAARPGEPDRAEASGALLSEGQSRTLDDDPQAIYRRAAQALASQDVRQADFWLARYLGVTALTFSAGQGDGYHSDGYHNLIPLFDQREDLVPLAFISGHYSEDFLDFFIRGSYELWAVPEARVHAADNTFTIRTFSQGKYVVELVGSPMLLTWVIIGDDIKSKAVIPLVSRDPPAVLVVGIRREGEPVRVFPRVALQAGGDGLQYLWPIEAHDLEGDGTPEIWIRYNEAWGDGFSQVLEIYKIEHEAALVLFKRFEGPMEGIARRLEDGTIEVAKGFTDQALNGHMGFDQHHIETFTFQQGEFVKVAERNVPHLLWDEEWQRYYFGEGRKTVRMDTR